MTSDCFSRTTVVSPDVQRGSVELPPSFFDRTGIEPGHHVAIRQRDLTLRAVAKLNEMMRGDEVRISPRLSVLMGVAGGDIICIENRTTFGDRVFDELETVADLLVDRAERLRGLLGMDISGSNGMTVEDALDGMARSGRPGGKDFLAVPPNAPGSIAVQVCELDPSQDVEVWDPDPAGKARVFRPEPPAEGN